MDGRLGDEAVSRKLDGGLFQKTQMGLLQWTGTSGNISGMGKDS